MLSLAGHFTHFLNGLSLGRFEGQLFKAVLCITSCCFYSTLSLSSQVPRGGQGGGAGAWEKGGGRYSGGGNRGGRKWDSQMGGKWEKWVEIMQQRGRSQQK